MLYYTSHVTWITQEKIYPYNLYFIPVGYSKNLSLFRVEHTWRLSVSLLRAPLTLDACPSLDYAPLWAYPATNGKSFTCFMLTVVFTRCIYASINGARLRQICFLLHHLPTGVFKNFYFTLNYVSFVLLTHWTSLIVTNFN